MLRFGWCCNRILRDSQRHSRAYSEVCVFVGFLFWCFVLNGAGFSHTINKEPLGSRCHWQGLLHVALVATCRAQLLTFSEAFPGTLVLQVMGQVLYIDSNHCFEEEEKVKTGPSASAAPVGSDLSGPAHLPLREERNQSKSGG